MFGKKSPEYISWLKKKEYLDKLPYDLKAANTGSTAGFNAFDYKYWEITGANLGWQPQTLYYDFQMLKKYGSHLAKGANVYISIEEFKFLVDFYLQASASHKYYFILDPEQIYEYDKHTDKLLKSFPCIKDKRLFKSEIVPVIKKIIRYESNVSAFDSVEEKDIYWSERWIRGWYNEFDWENDDSHLNEKLKEKVQFISGLLEEMLMYCYEKQWNPYLVIVPMSPNIINRLPQHIMDECLWEPINFFKEKKYKVIDLYHDKRFGFVDLYENALTLNEKGKELFNGIVQEQGQR